MRKEFSKSVRLDAWKRCKGHCECGCGLKVLGGVEYDHFPIPAALGGPATLENCRVLMVKHHRQITAETDVPAISKSQRVFEKRIGARKTKRPFAQRKDPWGKGRDQ